MLCGLGILAAMLLLSGHWLWKMWVLTGNPVFPWLNNILPSPLALADSNRELARLPKSPAEALFYPLFFTLKPWILNLPFRDAKFLVLYTVVPAAIAYVGWSRLVAKRRLPWPPGSQFLLSFLVISYLTWIVVFGTYRYAIVIEMLAPLAVVVCLAAVLSAPRLRRLAVGAPPLAMLLAVQPGDWGRRDWDGEAWRPFVNVAVPAGVDLGRAMVVVPGWRPGSSWRPSAFVIPAFPAAVPFLRISSMDDPGQETITGFDDDIRQRIAVHRGPLYVRRRRRGAGKPAPLRQGDRQGQLPSRRLQRRRAVPAVPRRRWLGQCPAPPSSGVSVRCANRRSPPSCPVT